MKKRLLIGFILLLVLSLCACGGETDPELTDTTAPVTTEAPETAPPPLALNNFVLIRGEDAPESTVNIASDLYGQLRGMGDYGIKFSDDYVARDTTPDPAIPEILFGLTNRPESTTALEALPGYLDYSITRVGEKLCIAANTNEQLAEAVSYLMANIEVIDGQLCYKGGDFVGKYVYPIQDCTIGGISLGDFAIVYAKDNARDARTASTLAAWIAAQTGLELNVVDDSAAEVKNEILIGKSARAASLDPAAMPEQTYAIKVSGGKLLLASTASGGYNTIKERLETLMKENQLTADFAEETKYEASALDGGRVMFVGNSFIYYGRCASSVQTKNKIIEHDKGYFYQTALAMGDEVDVTAVTWGGAGLTSLCNTLKKNHPNTYGSAEMDPFYDQDYVILQQEGSNASSTYDAAHDIMALFPPETKFAFFIHHHNAQNNHTNVLNAAAKMRDEEGVIYIPSGNMMYDIWTRKAEVPGATLKFNKNSFVVNWNDSHHPNYLNGYLTALATYYALTGRSIVDVPHDFVDNTMEYYTKAKSNYAEILASDADMLGLKQLTEEYVRKYNP